MATATMPRVRIRHRLRPLALGTLAVCQFLLAANTVAAQRPAVLPPISEVDPSSIRNATLFAPSPSSSCPPFLLPAPTPRPLPHLGTCHPSAQTPCCLPCPHFFTLYPPKATVALLHTTSFLRLISGLAAVFVFFSYLILPGKRTFPRVLVLYVSICVTMWHLAGLSGFDGQDGKTFFCSAEEGRGDVEGSEGTNNLKCAVQGLVLIYSGLGIAAWGLVMILNLHLQIVWQSAILSRHIPLLHILAWGLPLAITALTIYFSTISHTGSATCFLPPGATSTYFFPLIGSVVSIGVLHLGTSAWLWWKGYQAKKTEMRQNVDSEGEFEPSALPSPTLTTRTSMTLRDSAAEDRLRTRAATGVEVEYSGIKSVQRRLLSLGLVLCVIYTAYFAFFQTDLLVLSKSVTPKTISEAGDARDTPLQSFLVCLVEEYLEDTTKPYDVLRDMCEQQLKQSGEISFPSSAYRLIVESLISIAGVLATAAVSHLLITDWKKYLRTKGWLYSDSPIGRVVSVVRRRRNTHNSSNRSRDPYGAAADYGIPLSATLPLSSSPPSASTFRSYDGLLPRVYTSGGLHTPSPPSALSAYDEIKFNRFSPLQVSSPETSIPTGISRSSQSPRGSRDRSRSDSGGTLGLARRAEASLTLDPRDIMRPLPPPPRSPPPVLTPITASLSDAAALAQSFRTIDSTPDHPSVVVNSVVEREVYGGSFKPW